MWIYFERAAEIIAAQPVLPASILLAFLVVYSIVSLFGLIDLDMDAPDFDFDADFDLGSAGGFGMLTFRWLNLAQIPIVIWGGLFTLLWWITSAVLWVTWDASDYQANWWTAGLLSARSAVIGVVLTKFTTEPMKKWFVTARYNAEMLLGQVCQICTGQADTDFGQARFKTDAAPLLLNVRTDGVTLKKGDLATIIDFDQERRIYTVTAIDDEVQADE
ncbi:OB-fold-containig protein [Rosistilla ulvae]|uniref:OB-fold-containig protein n=1 Tax=Rosistilla TaxID=2795779 RepID=UPI00119DD909|nr:OB-fold-containig protein [Rosistilla ulvae]